MKKLTQEEFIKRATEIHNGFYSYTKTKYITAKVDVIVEDPEHGLFNIRPDRHLAGRGCQYRNKERKKEKQKLGLEQFVIRAKKIHKNNCDYTKSVYIDIKTKMLIRDTVYGEFWQTPEHHLRGQGHPDRNPNINVSRISLTWLLSVDPEQKFITPYQEPTLMINGRKRKMDGYDPTTNTVYQYHGGYWHGHNGKEITDRKRYENTLIKDQEIRDCGYNLVIMWEHDWKPTDQDWKRLPGRKSDTEIFIEKAKTLYDDLYDYSKVVYRGRKTKVCIVDTEYKIEFWQSPIQHLKGKHHLLRYNRSKSKSKL